MLRPPVRETGSKERNAISLGLIDHKSCLEKPLNLDDKSFLELAGMLRTFVKVLNSELFKRILDRTARNKDDSGDGLIYSQVWTWNFVHDRRRFNGYYRVFASNLDSIPSPEPFAVYERFRNAFQYLPKGKSSSLPRAPAAAASPAIATA